ncbi:hypothetical protein, partial [Escherichia coli]|uniref:hypothetical protein n=1 Tax=Escherichia coli TaxID=562 RepID=UPI001BFD10D5
VTLNVSFCYRQAGWTLQPNGVLDFDELFMKDTYALPGLSFFMIQKNKNHDYLTSCHLITVQCQ